MTDTITSESLYHAILHGAASIREKREDLNRINVFPVIDYDTGNNLAHTMSYILNHATVHDTVKETLRDIARSALISARGNSGAIFSQYFNGLYLESTEKPSVTLTELANCFQEAYNKASIALENVVEGTVITLMRAWAVSFKEALHQHKSPHELFQAALDQIRLALEETRVTLRELKSLGLVDAGALGFYYFMEGFVQALAGQHRVAPDRIIASALPDIDENIHKLSENTIITFRYCTEVLLESALPDQVALRQALHNLGDCLLVASADNLVRVHLHTNEPWEMVKIAAAHGRIIEQKADDMVLQNLLAGSPEKKIACITDSIADLPREFVFRHDIFQLPINILIDQVSYLDKITIDRAYLYKHLDRASSAQLNREQIIDYLTPILNHYDQALILTVSSQMSGTYSRFKEVLAELDPDARRTALIDTKVNSGAQGLLVQAAVGLIESGSTLADASIAIEQLKTRTRILVSVLDIEPMARSGRVSEKIGQLLIKLKFKPLVSISPDGKGTIRGVAFSEKKNKKILLKELRRRKIEDYVIVHADATDRAMALKDELVRITGKEPRYITDISAVVALYAGQGCVAVAFIEKAAKQTR
jgi:hypothetical protein